MCRRLECFDSPLLTVLCHLTVLARLVGASALVPQLAPCICTRVYIHVYIYASYHIWSSCILSYTSPQPPASYHIYIYIYMYRIVSHIYIYIYTCIISYIHMYICTCIYDTMHVYRYDTMQICIHVCIQVYIYIYIIRCRSLGPCALPTEA